MSNQDLSRYDVIKRLIRGDLNGSEAAQLLNLSVRQTKRLKAAVKQHGPKGLIHGNRGRVGHRRLPDKERKQIIELLREHYYDFWPLHVSEKLDELHGIVRDPKTIRQIMIDEGLWKPRKRKKALEYRQWRQRKAHYGEMEQFDGSYHHWFEDRLPGEHCLLLSVDDAGSAITCAKFTDHEDLFSVFGFWNEYFQIHGKPMAIYLDKFSTYSMNHKLAKENPDTLTQFQRAMKELRIEVIPANSPQAKGRVETKFGVLQNRLIKEMRLKGISTKFDANLYLKNEYIPKHNAKYSLKTRGKANLHNRLTQPERKKLPAILSRQTERTVQNDFTVSFNSQWYQLTKKQLVTIQKKDKVIVEERLDGSAHIRLRGKYLNYKPLPSWAKQAPGRKRQMKKTWVLPANATAVDLGDMAGQMTDELMKVKTN